MLHSSEEKRGLITILKWIEIYLNNLPPAVKVGGTQGGVCPYHLMYRAQVTATESKVTVTTSQRDTSEHHAVAPGGRKIIRSEDLINNTLEYVRENDPVHRPGPCMATRK